MSTPVDLVVVGTSIDSHIQAVLDQLPEYVSVCRFDIDKFPSESQLSITFDGSQKLTVESVNGVYDISRPAVVWFRRLGAIGVSDRVPSKFRQFALQEAEHTLIGALSVIEPRRWINEYWATKRAANKLVQYKMARQVGLLTPDTLISNSSSQTREWLLSRNEAISKSIQSPMIISEPGSSAFSFTSRTPPPFSLRTSEIEATPCQYQPFLEKDYELRVTSIRGRHYAVRIDTPEDAENDLDWRTSDCTYSNFRLDNKTTRQLSDLMSNLGLDYGASDFLVTRTGDIVFLEINPHGAWLWLEQNVEEFNFTDNLASEITRNVLD